tara:strand:+ start:3790 stop:5118 length:1329 start_codon:yes stop_codon:yes gene_type:complete
MYKILLTMLCVSSFIAKADWADAIQAFEAAKYQRAETEFKKLIEVGNDLAAFNLAAMAYHGQGQPANLVKAVAYFMLAAELGHKSAGNLATQLAEKFTVAEQQLVRQQLLLLQDEVAIPKLITKQPADEKAAPQVLKRVNPKYPSDAARAGRFGYVNLRIFVDEDGTVQSVDTLDAFPKGVFEKESIRAVKRWRYEAGTEKHIQQVRLDFTLDGEVNVDNFRATLVDNKIWEYAVAGLPAYQEALGTMLEMVSMFSRNDFDVDKGSKLTADLPDLSVFSAKPVVNITLPDFEGRAWVKVASDGKISQAKYIHNPKGAEAKQLIGVEVSEKLTPGRYALKSYTMNDHLRVAVSALNVIPESLTSGYWWEVAARNGDKRAQQIMAVKSSIWERYLIAQQDPVVMAWSGSKLILDGNREEGLALLDQAIALNYPQATELKKQFNE